MSLYTALISSLVIVSVIFTAVVFALCGAVKWTKINEFQPLLSVSKDAIVQVVISVGALVASPTVILTEAMALSRILYMMSCDHLLPKCLSRLYRHQPVYAVLVAMAAISLMAFLFDVNTLGSLTSVGVRDGCLCLLVYPHQPVAHNYAVAFFNCFHCLRDGSHICLCTLYHLRYAVKYRRHWLSYPCLLP